MGALTSVATNTGAATAIAPPPSRLEIWRPVVAAMGKTGAASLLSAGLSALATKILAVTVGPAAVALLATLQQTRQMALVAATGNGQTALVQGASAFHGDQRREYLRTVAWLFLGATVAVALALVGAPRLMQTVAGMPPGTGALLGWLAISRGAFRGTRFLKRDVERAGRHRAAGSAAGGRSARHGPGSVAGVSMAARRTRPRTG
jgi:hypothetical protein